MEVKEVKLEIPAGKDADGKEKKVIHPYSVNMANTKEDVAVICAEGRNETEAAEYLVKAFNYGHDLIVRQRERQIGSKKAEGPEKQIQKGVDFLLTQGMTADAARAFIVAQRQAAGLPV
jgi:rhodanese-related sulfurtransferase